MEDAPGFHFHQVASLTVECERDSSLYCAEREIDVPPRNPSGNFFRPMEIVEEALVEEAVVEEAVVEEAVEPPPGPPEPPPGTSESHPGPSEQYI